MQRPYTAVALLLAITGIILQQGGWLVRRLGNLESAGCHLDGHSSLQLIIVNASIWTGEEDKEHASSMAVYANGTIACIDLSLPGDILESGAQVLDMQGRFISPGFIDPHIHMIKGGLSLVLPDIASCASVAELKSVISKACKSKENGGWVYSYGWDESLWGGQQPSKDWLDEACPDKPVALERMCGHKSVVNSKAAAASGLTKDTPDPEGGKIYRDEFGHFTGLLAENAVQLIIRSLPKRTLEEKRMTVLAASQYLLSKGVTMTHDMGDLPTNEAEAFENLEHVYLHLAEKGDLPIRLFAFMPLTAWQRTADFVASHELSEKRGHVFWGGLKEFADGSLGSSTALFEEPYIRKGNEAPTSGVRNIPTDELQSMAQEADKEGLQIAIHAIGDLAVEEVLTLYEKLAAARPNNRIAPRHRMEHSQHHSTNNIPSRLAKAGVHVVANPLHLLPDKRVLEAKLGKERSGAGRSYPLQSMQKAAVQLSFASDWPVVPSDPLLGMYAAAFRSNIGEAESFGAEEQVSLLDALRASTIEGARLVGLEDKLGTLRKGKAADFVVLSRDPLEMTKEGGLPSVLQTFVNGKCQFGCN